MNKYYCNKCEKAIKEKDLNQLEKEEIGNNFINYGVPSFVCSDCINKEMEEEEENEKGICDKCLKKFDIGRGENFELVNNGEWYCIKCFEEYNKEIFK